MRNIILIVVDTLRADHLGCYGYQRPTSPFLDSLAKKSLVLDACYSTSNFTAPAFTSLFTATYLSRPDIVNFYSQAHVSPVKTVLDANSVCAEGVVSFRFFKNLLARIWGELEAVTETRSFNYSKDLPRAISDGAIEWLEKNGKKKPFCLFLHYDGPHIPYRLPDEYAGLFDTVDANDVDPGIRDSFFPQHLERWDGSGSGQKSPIPHLKKLINDINTRRRRVDEKSRNWIVDKYDASIKYTDDMISRVYEALQRLGMLDDTIVAILSDHGEEFWDHGFFGHGDANVYDEVIRTVGIIHDPSEPLAKRTDLPISHVQILPSLLCLAGAAEIPEQIAALDLQTAVARRAAGGPPEPVFSIGTFKSVVRLDNLKWIHTRLGRHHSLLKRLKSRLRLLWIGKLKDELYDLATDPGERVNLAKQRQRIRPLAALLEQHLEESDKAKLLSKPLPEQDAEEREKIEKELRNLGYM
ncbi:MAG: sulfatase-like hydrolase/transferase [Candidatus Latescibacteria bacterium]|nr:sulfatase-like hydrolase/transferase [Candidatus Latescibacterota bacterium]NIO55409.1 sulfatase-like hydrolase/transferase [Candidatus Latescibacterota bacterium]